jgi:hypothetical protein
MACAGVKEATAAHNGAGLVLLLLATLIIAGARLQPPRPASWPAVHLTGDRGLPGMALSLHLISEMDFDPPMINVNFT